VQQWRGTHRNPVAYQRLPTWRDALNGKPSMGTRDGNLLIANPIYGGHTIGTGRPSHRGISTPSGSSQPNRPQHHKARTPDQRSAALISCNIYILHGSVPSVRFGAASEFPNALCDRTREMSIRAGKIFLGILGGPRNSG
jgi:hypothetical protein